MAGLLDNVLPAVYSAGNRAKRYLGDLLADPIGNVQQAVGHANDRARTLNQMTAAAADEGVNFGPATRALGTKMADAYNPAGITVWHGSGKLFPKFDVNQKSVNGHAYTKGAYLADARSEAENYVPRDPVYEDRLVRMYNEASRRNDYNSMQVLEEAMLHSRPAQLREQFLSSEYEPAFQKTARRVIDQIEKLPRSSYIYKVDLADEAVPQLLKWDRPLAENPAAVQSLAGKLGLDAKRDLGGDVIGRLRSSGVDEAALRQELQKNGIPGLSYDSPKTRGSLNHVIYNPELLKLLEINDRPARSLLD